jgi:hypothetical protein
MGERHRRVRVRAVLRAPLQGGHLVSTDWAFTDGTEARISSSFGPGSRLIVRTNVGGITDEMSLTEFSRRFPEHVEAIEEEQSKA